MQSHREAAWMQGQYVQAQGQYVQGHPVPLSAQTSPGQLVETEMLQVQLQMQMAQQHALHESIQRTAIMLETARKQESHRGMASHRGAWSHPGRRPMLSNTCRTPRLCTPRNITPRPLGCRTPTCHQRPRTTCKV